MRRLAVVVSLILLLALSLGAGWIAADWPHWCQTLGLCDGKGVL
jgi:hypothetical protein